MKEKKKCEIVFGYRRHVQISNDSSSDVLVSIQTSTMDFSYLLPWSSKYSIDNVLLCAKNCSGQLGKGGTGI